MLYYYVFVLFHFRFPYIIMHSILFFPPQSDYSQLQQQQQQQQQQHYQQQQQQHYQQQQPPGGVEYCWQPQYPAVAVPMNNDHIESSFVLK